MVRNLEKAFTEASKLPEDEQEALAAWILNELAAEKRWGEAFASSQESLSELADEAQAEHLQGRTEELHPHLSPLPSRERRQSRSSLHLSYTGTAS